MQPGQTLGSYRIIEPLGAGGMGEVYLAEDLRLERKVAIKVLPAGVAADPERLTRLEQEARLLAQLEHPNVATIYGLEQAQLDADSEPIHHLVMQLVDGEPLAARLAGGALPASEALEIARQIAAGVGAAHDQGIIHRDLKPANVMVVEGPGGQLAVKVLDFGLAKALRDDPASGADDLTASPTMAAATAAGVIMGTAAYMSPEQARGKPVDRRTDVWAFGCLLYEMLTGRAAFEGETVSDIIAAILTKRPDWTALGPDLPDTVQRVIKRCLASDVNSRPYDVRDAMLDLDTSDDSRTAPEALARPGASQSTLRPRLLAAALVLVAGLSGYTVALLTGVEPGATPQGVRTSVAPTRHDQVTFQQGAETSPSITPDGDWVVYASPIDGDWDIYLQAVGGENAINLTEDSPADDLMPSLSADGRQIVFRSERGGGGIYTMGRTGESVRRVTDIGFNPSWAPDGTTIAITTERIDDSPYARDATGELWLVETVTGEVTVLPTEDAAQASFSPDGAHVVYWGVRGNTGQRDLWVAPVDGGSPVALLDDTPTDWTPVFTPDGSAVVFSSDRGGTPGLWRLPVDPTSYEALGDPEILVPGTLQWVAYPSFAANTGQLIYASMGADVQVHQVKFDVTSRDVTDGPRPLTSGARHALSPDISPDEQWIAFSTGLGQQEDVFVQRVDGTLTRRLTNDVFKDRSPRFSPDGDRLVFYADREGGYKLWTMGVDGSDLRLLTADTPDNFNYAFWAPTGDRLAASGSVNASNGALITLLTDSVAIEPLATELPEGLTFSPSGWSPDGGRIVGGLAAGVRGVQPGVVVFDMNTGETEQVSERGWYPTWLADNRHVAAKTANEIWITDTVSGDSWLLLSVFPNRIVEYMSSLRSEAGLVYAVRRQEDDLWLANWE